MPVIPRAIQRADDEHHARAFDGMFDHAKRREGDEWYCRRCGKRWATDEKEPDCE